MNAIEVVSRSEQRKRAPVGQHIHDRNYQIALEQRQINSAKRSIKLLKSEVKILRMAERIINKDTLITKNWS